MNDRTDPSAVVRAAKAAPADTGALPEGDSADARVRELEARIRELEADRAGRGGDGSDDARRYAAARASDDPLRRLADNLPGSALYEYARAPDGTIRFLYVSRGIERLCGVSSQEILRNPHALRGRMVPGYLEQLERAESLCAVDLADLDIEVPIRLADSSIRWLRLQAHPRSVADGGVVWGGVLVDVTDGRLVREALERTSNLLAEAQQIAHLGSFEYVAATKNTIWSDEEYRIYGLDPARGSPSYETMLARCIHPEDSALVHETFAKAMQSQSTYELEHRVVRPDGSVRWVYDRAHPHIDEKGKLSRYVGATLDITDRKAAEIALRLSQQRLTGVLESMPDAFVSFDAELRYTYVNSNAERLQGTPREDLLGKDVRALYPDPESRKTIAIYEQVLRDKSPATSTSFHAGFDRWVEVRAFPTPDGMSVFYKDVSAQAKAEDALRESEAQFRVLTENLQLAVALIDENGKFTIVNSAFLRMFEIPEDAQILNVNSRDWAQWRVFDERGLPLHVDDHPVRQAVATRTAVRNRLVAVKSPHSHDLKWLLVSVAPLLTARGNIHRLVCTYYDITDRRFAEEALRQSEMRFRLALRNAPVSVATQDRDLRYVWAFNQKTALPEQIVGHFDHEIFAAEEAARLTAIKRRVLEEGVELRERMWLERPSGQAYWDICWEPIRDERGQVVGVASAAVDLTPLKLAEEALRRYELVVQQTRDMILFMRREDGRILEANPAAIAAYGISRDELLQLTVHDLRGPGTHEVLQDQMREAGARGVLFESLHRRKDGTTFPVEVSSRAAGEETLVSVVRDISERRNAEAREREQRQQAERRAAELDAIFNSLAQPVVVTNAQGELLRTNPAYRSLFQLPDDTHPIDVAERTRRLQTVDGEPLDPGTTPGVRALSGEEVSGVLQRWPRPDGAFAYLSVSAAPIRTSEGIVGMVGIFTDVTDRVRAEQALQDADHRKNEFLAVLSHELRNPLTPITNSLYILDHAPRDSEQATRAKQVIARQVAQLSSLVNDLLDVTRISRNKIRLAKERIELNEIAHRAVEDNRSLFDKAGVLLEMVRAPRPIHLLADRTRVAQIIGNLLQNAAKFTPAGGNTRLTIGAEGAAALVRVVDNGVGMAAESLSRLFQAFMQVDQTLDRSKGGLGLGLALVKGLVELHGGSVSARSAGIGKGMEFTVRVPVAAEESVDAAMPLARPEAMRRRVLIVEDHHEAAQTLREVLELDGHDVQIAHDGPEALARARAFKPELVLCDIGLPGMDGYEVAAAFRADPALAQTYLVALSGYALPDDLRRAAEAGFAQHLAKPPNLDKLNEVLAKLSRVPSRGAPR